MWLFLVASAGSTWLQSISKWAADSEGRVIVALQTEPRGVYIGDASLPLWNTSRNIKMSLLTDQYDRGDTVIQQRLRMWNFRTLQVSGKTFSGAIIMGPVLATVCLRHDSNSKHFKYIRKNYTVSQITKAKFLFSPFMFHVLSFVWFPDLIGLWALRADILISLSPLSPLPHEFSDVVVVVALLNTVAPVI